MVEYYYDAWGNHKWTGDETLAKRNPFRYRGYYYDEETGLYFLKSRYYDPQIGRFINIDSLDYADPETINGLNLYAYCNNNPVMYVDPTGHFWFTFLTTVFGAIVGAIGGLIDYAVNSEGDFSVKELIKGMIAGFAAGATAGFILGLTKGAGIKSASYISAAVYSTTLEVLDYIYGDKEISTENIVGSVRKIVGDTFLNGTMNYFANLTAGKLIRINSGWFVPKKFLSYFTKQFGLKMIGQTLISAEVANLFVMLFKIIKD